MKPYSESKRRFREAALKEARRQLREESGIRERSMLWAYLTDLEQEDEFGWSLDTSPYSAPDNPADRDREILNLLERLERRLASEIRAAVHATTQTPLLNSSVFISYSSRDEPRAREFVAELETAGLTCWYAGGDITPGARGYHSRILEAINGSLLVVVLCSRNSVESSHVANELEHATGLKRPMLPVLLEGFDPTELGDLSYFLKRFQMVRLPAPPGTVSRLAAGIADELGINS